jgi:hypothetical protein
MKASGQYDQRQSAIRRRDIALQGHINPVPARFGESSEALKYSGRASGGCPFHAVPAGK